MKHAAKAGPHKRGARKRVAPAPAPVEPAELVNGVERASIEAAEQFEPDRNLRSERTDIERVDERRLGSVQSLPEDAQPDPIVSFTEPE